MIPATSHRKTMGRSARRRRKKLLEIQKAQEQLLSQSSSRATTTNDAKQDLQIIPSDRDKMWPGVEERRRAKNHTWSKDAVRITAQLGYLPGNATRVETRAAEVPLLSSSLGVDPEEPVVLQLYPIAVREEHVGGKANRKKKQRKRKRMVTSNNNNKEEEEEEPEDPKHEEDTPVNGTAQEIKNDQDDAEEYFVVEPFPTLYWLTHPLLKTLVSRMELQSMGVRLEKRLAQDSDALASIEKANKAYGQERYNLLTAKDLEFIQKRKWEGAFDPKRGVAGIRNYASVKCLHAHVAHYLSQGEGSKDNILGQWVMQEIEATCRDRLGEEFDEEEQDTIRTSCEEDDT